MANKLKLRISVKASTLHRFLSERACPYVGPCRNDDQRRIMRAKPYHAVDRLA
jgi:hypothetical protein